ncbi:MAG: glutamine amidotransferase family protein [Elusimicrobiota bacterium]|jgi:glutamate synthase domain-containing protein 1|nr:glutamine amidotransferase family protein [Elusimicrobiota bacterium]
MFQEGALRIPSGCAISGIINKNRKRINGESIVKSIALMHDRSNGLGGGFAAYGIYPNYKDFFALHIFYDSLAVKTRVEEYLDKQFEIESAGNIPTRPVPSIINRPMIWRYFVKPRIYLEAAKERQMDENEFTAQCVIKINKDFNGAYVFSSGKNMGTFKGVGYPEDIGEFFMLDTYEAHTWTAHGRFPTNTPGWWGGAHPFTMLDWSVVHNGEISSYDTNRRFVEMFSYNCSLQTDTEVITYLFDLLVRKQGLSLQKAMTIMCPPFWDDIERESKDVKEELKSLRAVYSSALINGPFSILVGFEKGLIALNDRIKLRSMVAAQKGDTTYMASEESAIRLIAPSLDRVWSPKGGEPVIALLNDEEKKQ